MSGNLVLPVLETPPESSADVPRKRATKVKFTPEQDRMILSLLKKDPTTSWRTIAERIEGKTSKQCRERYQHYLAPTVERKPWTADEDCRLCIMYNQMGPRWALLTHHFPGRTNQDLKNRFNWHLRNRQLDVFLDAMESHAPLLELQTIAMPCGCF